MFKRTKNKSALLKKKDAENKGTLPYRSRASLLCPRDFCSSHPNKHSDLVKSSFNYGNGCCNGFSPLFPYHRSHRLAVYPAKRASPLSSVFYSFVLILYHKKACFSIKYKIIQKTSFFHADSIVAKNVITYTIVGFYDFL